MVLIKKIVRTSILLFFSFITGTVSAQTVLQTSFEEYIPGNLSGQNNWNHSLAGTASVITDNNYAHSGSRGVQLSSSSAVSVQLDHIAFSKTTTGLSGIVYFDCWLKFNTAPSIEVFHISAYDLTPDGSEKRAFVFEFSPVSGSLGQIKVFNGSSRTAYGTYNVGEWFRISAMIDYSALKYRAAINGTVIDAEFNFRESYNASERGRATDTKEYHQLRFYFEDDILDLAMDDIYIGTEDISDVPFPSVSTQRTLKITQPSKATITVDPDKEFYEAGDTVIVTILADEHYRFVNWTGSFSGNENPLTIIIGANATLGAEIEIDPDNPPVEYSVTINQSLGGQVSVSPANGPYYEGDELVFTATPDIGFEFDSWSGIQGNNSEQSIIISENLTVSAAFNEGIFTERIINVSNASELDDALDDLQPGDHIILADGIYNNVRKSLTSKGGTPSAPVLIEAANKHGAKINGEVRFFLTNCAYITFKGIDFDVQIYTLFKLTGCNNIRITENVFKNSGSDGSKLIIIGDEWDNTSCVSHHNQIDHNLFDGKSDDGAWIVLDGCHGDGGDFQVSQYDRINHNHFRFNTPRVTNEKETIRVGMSDLSLSSGFCTIENNLFEECDGDPEIISVKSCDNFIRNNTFIKCLGTVSLRHGNRTEVSGNFFLGQNKTASFEGSTIGCGGVRVYGKDHKIFNNYFEGLTGSLWDAACTLTQGDASNYGVTQNSDLTKHYVVENLEFSHNTLVNNASDIEIGYRTDWGREPVNCLIANNIIVQDKNRVTKVHETGSDAGVHFADNIIYTSGTGVWGDISFSADEAVNEDPLLVLTDCRAFGSNCEAKIPIQIYKLTGESPARDAQQQTHLPMSARMLKVSQR